MTYDKSYHERKKADPEYRRKRVEAYERFKKTPAYKTSYDKKNAAAKISGRAALQNRKTQLKKYGLTPEDYDRMVVAQDNKCAICGGGPRPEGFLLGVDHCHKTNKNRGLLCLPCNHAMGIFKDDAELLKAAVSYLERYAGDSR